MYVVELAFTDDPRRLEARPRHRKHLESLHEAGIVRSAGPFTDESGALLVFDVADEAELAAVMASDPYYRAPGVTVVRRQQWNPLF